MTNTVDQTTTAVDAMRAATQTIQDLLKGGAAMRDAGQRYLPKFPVESEEDYSARKASTWLFNGVEKCRDDMVSKVFEKSITLADQDGQLQEWCENVDLEGRDLSNFAQDVFKAAVADGIAWVLADAPARDGTVTRGEAQAMGLRPYLALITLWDVLGWQWKNVNNAPTLTHFRFMESVPDPENGPFDDKRVDQVRSLTLENGRVVVRLYRKAKTDKGQEAFIQIEDDLVTDATEIMAVPVYTGRTGFMAARPPLRDLAELNLAHWRIQSDKSNCLHKSLSPLLFMKQMAEVGDGGSAVVNSAGYGFTASGDGADMKWVEISGSGISEGRTELKDLEQQMQWAGLQLIMERSGVSTATGDAIDESKSTTRLKMWADNLKDALEIALGYMTDLGGIDADTTVIVNTDFATLGTMTMTDIRDMYNSGAISQATYIKEAQRRGILSEDVNPDDEVELADVEAGRVDVATGNAAIYDALRNAGAV